MIVLARRNCVKNRIENCVNKVNEESFEMSD